MPEESLQTGSARGRLQINVTSSLGLIPVKDAAVTISYSGEPNAPIEKLSTDSSGQTEQLSLPAPPDRACSPAAGLQC